MIHIDIETFIEACNTSNSMMEAASKLEIQFSTFKRYAIKLGMYKPNRGLKGSNKPKVEQCPLSEILEGKHPQFNTYKLKNKLIKAGIKENKCEICGISEWQGEPINCELHHKDGNSKNHQLDNLIILCPNCHSQTKTFRSRNVKLKKVS